MSETIRSRFTSLTFWPYIDENLRRELHDLAREARYVITPPNLHPALTSFHDPDSGGAGLLTLLAQALRELSGNLDEQTPDHAAVREALDDAAAHIAHAAGQHIATALALLGLPDQR
ncbi:hypothetical protein [Streptomyces sp. E-08]|uniref:hypothetical protein n=1 Tax=Streptomyces sp. E-08 TaxID=3404047 RepID=UPI003CF3E9F5